MQRKLELVPSGNDLITCGNIRSIARHLYDLNSVDAFVLMSSCTLYLLDDLLPFLHTGSCSKCSQKICDYCSLFVAAKDSFMMKYFLISEDFHAQGIMAGRQLVAIFGFLLLVLTSPPKADAGVNT